MALEDSLAKVPGLAGFLGRQQFDREQSLAGLQQASAAATLATALKAQQEGAQIKEVLASSPDLQTAIPKLAAMGPAGITVATHLAALEKARKSNELMTQAMSGSGAGGLNDPDTLDRLAQAHLAAGDHVNAAAVGTLADKRRAQLRDTAALSGMKSAPAAPAIAPDVQETTQAADQGLAAPAQSAPVPARPGGVPDYLLQSPHVGASAKSLQARIDAGMIPTAAAAEKQIENLGTAHNTMVQAKMMLEQRGAQAKELKTLPPGVNAAGELTPDAKEQAAARYNIDGTLPTNLGRGTQGAVNTAAILNRAAEQQKEAGNTPEAARVNQLANKASTMALGQLVKQKNLILAFENTAMKNADLVLQESEKVDRLGSPVIDRWILAGKKSIAGDPSVARLDLAVRTFVNEYARVTTSVTGGGITSDTARKEIDTLLQSAHTKDQVKQVIDLAKTEMLNRKAGYEDQEKTLKGGIGVSASASPAAVPSAGVWKITPIP